MHSIRDDSGASTRTYMCEMRGKSGRIDAMPSSSLDGADIHRRRQRVEPTAKVS